MIEKLDDITVRAIYAKHKKDLELCMLTAAENRHYDILGKIGKDYADTCDRVKAIDAKIEAQYGKK
jgi:hypothetical protein